MKRSLAAASTPSAGGLQSPPSPRSRRSSAVGKPVGATGKSALVASSIASASRLVLPTPVQGIKVVSIVGRTIWVGSRAGKMYIFDGATSMLVAELQGSAKEAVTAIAMDSTSAVWVGYCTGQMDAYNSTSRALIRSIMTQSASSARGITDIREIQPAGGEPRARLIWVASQDFTIRLFRPGSAEQLPSLSGHDNWVQCLEYVPSSDTVWSGSADCSILVWPANPLLPEFGKPVARLEGVLKHPVSCIAYSPAGHVWVGDQAGKGKILRADDCAVLSDIAEANLSAVATICSVDHSTMLVAGVGKEIVIYDALGFSKCRSIEQSNSGFISGAVVFGTEVWVGSSELRTYPIDVVSSLVDVIDRSEEELIVRVRHQAVEAALDNTEVIDVGCTCDEPTPALLELHASTERAIAELEQRHRERLEEADAEKSAVIQQLEEARSNAQSDLCRSKAELSRLLAELQEMEQRNGSLLEQLQVVRREVAGNTQALTSVRRECEEQCSKIEALQASILESSVENRALSERAVLQEDLLRHLRADMAGAANALENSQRQRDETRVTLGSVVRERDEALERVAELTSQLGVRSTEVVLLAEAKTQMEAENSRLLAELVQARQTLEEQEAQNQDLAQANEQLSTDLQQSREECQAANADAAAIQEELDVSESNVAELRRLLNQLMREKEELVRETNDQSESIRMLERQRSQARLERELDAERLAAMGRQKTSAADEERRQAAEHQAAFLRIYALEAELQERDTQLAGMSETVAERDRRVGNLERALLEMESSREADRAREARLQEDSERLKQQLSELNNLNIVLAEVRAGLARSEVALAEAKTQLAQRDVTVTGLMEEIALLKEKSDGLLIRCTGLEASSLHQEQRLGHCQQELDQKEKELRASLSEQKQLEAAVFSWKTKFLDVEMRLQQEAQTSADLRSQLDRLSTGSHTASERNENLRQELAEAELELSRATTHLELLRSEHESTVAFSHQQGESLQLLTSELVGERERLRSAQEAMDAARQQLEAERSRLEAEVLIHRQRSETLSEAAGSAEFRMTELHRENSRMLDCLQSLSQQLTAADSRAATEGARAAALGGTVERLEEARGLLESQLLDANRNLVAQRERIGALEQQLQQTTDRNVLLGAELAEGLEQQTQEELLMLNQLAASLRTLHDKVDLLSSESAIAAAGAANSQPDGKPSAAAADGAAAAADVGHLFQQERLARLLQSCIDALDDEQNSAPQRHRKLLLDVAESVSSIVQTGWRENPLQKHLQQLEEARADIVAAASQILAGAQQMSSCASNGPVGHHCVDCSSLTSNLKALADGLKRLEAGNLDSAGQLLVQMDSMENVVRTHASGPVAPSSATQTMQTYPSDCQSHGALASSASAPALLSLQVQEFLGHCDHIFARMEEAKWKKTMPAHDGALPRAHHRCHEILAETLEAVDRLSASLTHSSTGLRFSGDGAVGATMLASRVVVYLRRTATLEQAVLDLGYRLAEIAMERDRMFRDVYRAQKGVAFHPAEDPYRLMLRAQVAPASSSAVVQVEGPPPVGGSYQGPKYMNLG